MKGFNRWLFADVIVYILLICIWLNVQKETC